MATLTITIKDAYVPEMIEVFGEHYQATILDVDGVTEIPNPQTKAQFANQEVIRQIRQFFIKRKVMNYRERMAAGAVDQTDITDNNP